MQAWRAVEAQHEVATRKLVETLEEHDILESLLELHKPPALPDRLHYLLATPFRYPPLPHGSRFGTRRERGIWYGAEAIRTTFAEVAYYRLLFIHGTAADLGTVEVQLSLFRVTIDTPAGLDLCAAAFAPARDTIASKSQYRATQALGRDMRNAGVAACRYPSARDPEAGVGVAVLQAGAFAQRGPASLQTWYCFANRTRVEFRRKSYEAAQSYAFALELFLVNGRLPSPAA